ncbi:hypothetical protein BG005_005619, partial [Podila minutissima]
MVSSKYADRQTFESNDGTHLPSLKSHPCAGDTTERYVLWSDILRTFHGIDHLELDEERILFTIDDYGELLQPLCIQHDPYETYVVIYGDSQRQQTLEASCNIPQGSDDYVQGDSQSQALGEIQPSLEDLFKTCKYLYQHVKAVTINQRNLFQQGVANTRHHHAMLVKEIERLHKAGDNTLVDRKSQEQILEELRDREQQMRDLEYQRTCYSTL